MIALAAHESECTSVKDAEAIKRGNILSFSNSYLVCIPLRRARRTEHDSQCR